MMSDADLLRCYAQTGSEDPFTELVRRRLHLHSSSGRQADEATLSREWKRFQEGQEERQRQESRSLLQRVFGGEPAAMLVHLVEEANLSKPDIKKLKAILTEKEK